WPRLGRVAGLENAVGDEDAVLDLHRGARGKRIRTQTPGREFSRVDQIDHLLGVIEDELDLLELEHPPVIGFVARTAVGLDAVEKLIGNREFVADVCVEFELRILLNLVLYGLVMSVLS